MNKFDLWAAKILATFGITVSGVCDVNLLNLALNSKSDLFWVTGAMVFGIIFPYILTRLGVMIWETEINSIKQFVSKKEKHEQK